MCLARARASKIGGHLGEKNDKLELFSLLLLTYLSTCMHRLIPCHENDRVVEPNSAVLGESERN